MLEGREKIMIRRNKMTEISIKKAITDREVADCLKIRREVFIEGQHVPEEIELDGLEQESDNYLILKDNVPISTARIRYVNENGKVKAKIERVAVLSAYRGGGIGKRLMEYLLKEIEKNKKAIKIGLSAQSYIVPFYERLGYKVCSAEYMEAGIPHIDMQKELL
jgi:predicted GNAT family N-acyltransferase